MQTENKTKTYLMVAGLAAFVGIGAACFGLFGPDEKPASKPAAAQSCDSLTGQDRADCEKSQAR